jgi:hypothetical protein
MTPLVFLVIGWSVDSPDLQIRDSTLSAALRNTHITQENQHHIRTYNS